LPVRRPPTIVRFMRLQRLAALLIVAIVLARGSRLCVQQAPAPTVGVSVGFNSSDDAIYAAHLTIPLRTKWDLAPWVRWSATDQAQWRASIAVRRLFGPRSGHAYLGGGMSWTTEVTEVRAHGHLGAVALGGAELPLFFLSPQAARVRLFTELQVFTHHYATVQDLTGVRLRLGRP